MKFSQLPIGHPFRYQGNEYVKVSPLHGQQPGNTNRRLIPRSARVEAIGPTPESASPARTEVPVQELQSAMDRLGTELTDLITASGMDAEKVSHALAEIRKALARTRRRLRLD